MYKPVGVTFKGFRECAIVVNNQNFCHSHLSQNCILVMHKINIDASPIIACFCCKGLKQDWKIATEVAGHASTAAQDATGSVRQYM